MSINIKETNKPRPTGEQMTQDDLMAEDNQPEQIDPNKNYLAELVGEGKKFKTQEDLARGKAESDAYIKILEKRSDELRNDYLKLRDDYSSRAKLEEVVDQLTKSQQQFERKPDTNVDVNNKPVIDPKELESLVSSKIQEHELTKRQQENFNTVRTRLQERYGNSYQTVLKQHIDTLGLTEDFVNDLARKHPTVLFKTLGIDPPNPTESFQPPVRSSQGFVPSAPKERTWAYYQEIKKNDPKLYANPKTTVQMHEDYLRLGNAFEDGDFHAVR